MKNIDTNADVEDLKCLFIACDKTNNNKFFDFVSETKQSYCEYHKRNSENIAKYGEPKTFSQWINGQIISLT